MAPASSKCRTHSTLFPMHADARAVLACSSVQSGSTPCFRSAATVSASPCNACRHGQQASSNSDFLHSCMPFPGLTSHLQKSSSDLQKSTYAVALTQDQGDIPTPPQPQSHHWDHPQRRIHPHTPAQLQNHCQLQSHLQPLRPPPLSSCHFGPVPFPADIQYMFSWLA